MKRKYACSVYVFEPMGLWNLVTLKFSFGRYEDKGQAEDFLPKLVLRGLSSQYKNKLEWKTTLKKGKPGNYGEK